MEHAPEKSNKIWILKSESLLPFQLHNLRKLSRLRRSICLIFFSSSFARLSCKASFLLLRSFSFFSSKRLAAFAASRAFTLTSFSPTRLESERSYNLEHIKPKQNRKRNAFIDVISKKNTKRKKSYHHILSLLVFVVPVSSSIGKHVSSGFELERFSELPHVKVNLVRYKIQSTTICLSIYNKPLEYRHRLININEIQVYSSWRENRSLCLFTTSLLGRLYTFKHCIGETRSQLPKLESPFGVLNIVTVKQHSSQDQELATLNMPAFQNKLVLIGAGLECHHQPWQTENGLRDQKPQYQRHFVGQNHKMEQHFLLCDSGNLLQLILGCHSL
ncbi:ethylene induced calmodulin binding protein [Striga asiatica]|uniref:Ethylene induced calmodulin binding protein n=1 Tax=Striga asiatica TaxID=4170 RepID=A0A5A7PJP1_STRAF|nr:ethylene induced calmodulin binding protein [Striga asiatica]